MSGKHAIGALTVNLTRPLHVSLDNVAPTLQKWRTNTIQGETKMNCFLELITFFMQMQMKTSRWLMVEMHAVSQSFAKQSGSKSCRLFSLGSLQQMVYRHKISNTVQLKRMLINCWAQLSQDALDRVIDQLPKRLKVIKTYDTHDDFCHD